MLGYTTKGDSMAFGKQAAIVPVKIRDTQVTLFDPVPAGTERQAATVDVQIEMSDGSVVIRQFNLAEHFPPATISQLIAFVGTIRAKAVSEILPAA